MKPPRPSKPVLPEVTPETIRARAYEIWDRNHRPHGLEMQFWLAAERELRAERDRALAAVADGSGGTVQDDRTRYARRPTTME